VPFHPDLASNHSLQLISKIAGSQEKSLILRKSGN
jgi:hypothetical protein